MAAERSGSEPAHEVRLEGFKLVVSLVALGGVVLAAVVGAFLLGRWVERRAQGGGFPVASGGDPLAQVVDVAPDAAAEQGLTYFDHLEGQGKQLEPSREVGSDGPRGVAEPAGLSQPAEPLAETAPQEAAEGAFFVQVFAGRNRETVETLVARLRGEGYSVRLLTEREGQGALYRVRVGGYETEDGARAASRELQTRGYSNPWVTRSD